VLRFFMHPAPRPSVLAGAPDIFAGYPVRGFDETFAAPGAPRPHYETVIDGFRAYGDAEFKRRRGLIELTLRHQGITFTVYGDAQGTERAFPFDPFPRVIPASEWEELERGLLQRVRALNAFLHDIYHDQEILKEGLIPAALVTGNANFRPQMQGVTLPFGAYTHVVGCDLIRDAAGRYCVLEDNLRSPSGVSYMLANRAVMARSFPKLMMRQRVRPTSHYTTALFETLRSLSPRDIGEPTIVVLTPGQYNSAYYEHSYLAQQMGVELVEGRDLFVADGRVWMRTTRGKQQVDVIYRRIDDDFLDPHTFRPDSTLGVPGLMAVYRAGRVALANAVGTGVADDKAMYAYVPAMIRFYLNEAPLLPNVETYLGADPEMLEYICAQPEALVIKEVGVAGGYGMLVGSEATAERCRAFVAQVRRAPHNYIAQPIVQLSTHPTYYPDTGVFEPCHVDLRPYILWGETPAVIPGGLTRVALRRGSLVVNSSQGGGSKDTWVLEDEGLDRERLGDPEGALTPGAGAARA
jgi:uncharacterized circularly permuted ATP-grasp superfamily protein